MRMVRGLLAACAVVAGVAGGASAAPTIVELPANAGPFTFPVSSTDLLQTSLAGVTGTGTFNGEGGAGGPALLANGTFLINGGNPSNNSQLVAAQGGATATFALDTTANPLGYNVTSIETYGGWNDSGRDRQNFSIEYATVAAPTTFLPVDSINFEPLNTDGGISAVKATFSTALTNVSAIRFSFGASQENGHAGYGEFDVFGSAAVPEPASLAMVGLVAATALGRRRRR